MDCSNSKSNSIVPKRSDASRFGNGSLPLGSLEVTGGPSPSHPQQQRRISLRDPQFLPGCARSISLPQALHSFSLSRRNETRKRSHELTRYEASMLFSDEQSEIARDNNHSSSTDHCASSYPRASSHHASTSCSNPEFPCGTANSTITAGLAESCSDGLDQPPNFGLSGTLSPPLAKRAVSESQPKKFGNSVTTPVLADILYSREIEIPHSPSNVSSNHFSKEYQHQRPFHSSIPRTKNSNTSIEVSLDLGDQLYTPGAVQLALSNPDILSCIFKALDALTVIPHELVQLRRKPLSLTHAQLIFGDSKKALEAWENNQPMTTVVSPGSGLYNCLFVNRIWHDTACLVLEKNVHFRNTQQWVQFARRGVRYLMRKPRMLVLHKLNEATQVELGMLDPFNLGEHLEWLEFYTCAGLAPTPSLLGPNLKRIILPGCYRVNDRTLVHIAERCPQLEHLDVRACEQVTDRGIKMIAKYCPQLQLLNVGRTRGGEHITYKGVKHLARQTQLTTLGVAGCHIDDRAVWELALNRGPKLQRLSLNNCHLLTDASVPRVLGYMPNVTVLEIRGCINITRMRPLALFKAYRERQGQPPLIEGCEVIERRLQVAILRLQREISQNILADLSSWVNQSD